MRTGTVFIVGAGPGDPGLLTLRAAQLLSSADVVVHDRLIHPDVLAHARNGARLIYAGKEGGGDSTRQEDIHRELIAHARLGRSVVRLKGGDPFVFGRGGEEALALSAAGVPWEIVPGVSSGAAAPAAAGIPVTMRGISASVTFATAHLDGGEPDWAHLAGAPTLVLFMGVTRLAQVSAALVAAGRSSGTLAAVVEAGTWQHQRVVEGTLADIAEKTAAEAIGSPALLVVGDVVGVRQLLGVSLDSARGVGGNGDSRPFIPSEVEGDARNLAEGGLSTSLEVNGGSRQPSRDERLVGAR